MTQIPTWSGHTTPTAPINPPGGRTAPGTIIGGRYELRAAVGHGGMGTVWRAADTLLRRDVAVKEVILPPNLAASDRDAMYERTLREARAAAALSHPAVVQVYDVVTENGRPWIVMELLDARSLADMVVEDGPIGPRAVAKIGIALLGALEVAHAAGVLHRDVKPANVLIAADGRCVLTDFGVARMPADIQLTTPGMVLGSPHFISPERAMGQPFGPPSDLFSLGVTLYTAVEGRPPFDKGDPIETMHSVVEDAPAPMVRSGALNTVLYGLLEKDPSRRFDVATARTMLRGLLSGPLASQAPSHMMTDPYAVVPAQRGIRTTPTPTPPPPPAPAKEPKPTGEIGGRAMLAPGESLTDRLKKVRGGNRPTRNDQQAGVGQPTAAHPAPAPRPTDPDRTAIVKPADADRTAIVRPADADRTAIVRPADADRTAIVRPADADRTAVVNALDNNQTTVINQRSGPGQTNPTMPGSQGWDMPTGPAGAYHHPGTGVAVHGGMVHGGMGHGGMVHGGTVHGGGGSAAATARRVGRQFATTVRGWSRRTQLIAAGLAVVLLAGVVYAMSGDEPARLNPPAQQGATNQQPIAETQKYTGRGVAVNVPKDWKQSGTTIYVDFTDPDGSGRRVRILAEKAKTTPQRFMEIAEDRLKTSKSCAKPYERIGELREVTLAGQSAAELEYTCGSGDTKRHGLWCAIIVNKTAHSFYLTTPEGRFEESKPIFNEMVNSFALASQ